MFCSDPTYHERRPVPYRIVCSTGCFQARRGYRQKHSAQRLGVLFASSRRSSRAACHAPCAAGLTHCAFVAACTLKVPAPVNSHARLPYRLLALGAFCCASAIDFYFPRVLSANVCYAHLTCRAAI